jgi:hypothetical protein
MTDEARELFFGMASDRLVRRCRWAAVVLALSFAIPYEHVGGVPQFIWQILGELPPAAVIAAFSTSAAGLLLLAAAWRLGRASALALFALTALAGAWLVERPGGDRAAWDVLPLPESLADRPLAMLLGLALTGAGLNLAFKPHTRRAGRITLSIAALLVTLFYVWPARGEAPITTAFRIALSLPALPGFRFVLGHALVLGIVMFPAAIGALALLFALRPPAREPRLLHRIATFGLPALFAFFLFRSLLLSFGDSSLPATAGGIALLAALLGLLSSAAEVLIEEAPVRREATFAASVLGVLAGAQWWLARPPEKGIEWKLDPSHAEADQLFGETLPRWAKLRASWDSSVRERSSAGALVQLKAAEKKLRDEATSLDPGSAQAIAKLIAESEDLDLAGRRWYRLIADLNDANRRAGLPYYVDPAVRMATTPDGLRRRFGLHGYRIARVQSVRAGAEPFATLHVRRLGSGRSGHGRLGFSRDQQPFALVVLDEIEPIESELVELSRREPPSCSASKPSLLEEDLLAEDPPAPLGLERPFAECGKRLAEIAIEDETRIGPALVALTERHELQHQIDGPKVALSGAVLRSMSAHAHSAQELVNRELSAYVAELTSPSPAAPRLGLILLLRFAGARPGSSLYLVGVLAAEALTGRRVTNRFGGADATRLGEALDELLVLGDDELRQRARGAWRELFGARLAEIRPDE